MGRQSPETSMVPVPGSRATVSRRNGNSTIVASASELAKYGAVDPSLLGKCRGFFSTSRAASSAYHATSAAS